MNSLKNTWPLNGEDTKIEDSMEILLDINNDDKIYEECESKNLYEQKVWLISICKLTA